MDLIRYYACDWLTGLIRPRELHLTGVRLSRNAELTGTLSAELDMHALVGADVDLARCLEVIQLLQVGASSIIAVREAPDGDVVIGEWWVTGMRRQFSDSAIQIAGEEVGGYFARNVMNGGYFPSSMDRIEVGRRVVGEAMTTRQSMAFILSGDTSCGHATESDWHPGGITYAAALKECMGDKLWSLRLRHDKAIDPQGQFYVARRFVFEARPDSVASGAVIEFRPPGERPLSGVDCLIEDSVDRLVNELWGFGAGSGSSQIKHTSTYPRADGVPRISSTLTMSDVPTKERLVSEMDRAMRALVPSRQPITVTCRSDRIGVPVVGKVHAMLRPPSPSMPVGDQGAFRVVAWEWSQPKPGEADRITLGLERL